MNPCGLRVGELRDEVLAPELEPIHPELVRQLVHADLDQVRGLGPAGAADGVGGELVRVHPDDVRLERGEVVAAADHAGAERGDHRPLDQVVGAAVLDDLGVDPGQGPVALGAEPHVVDLVAPVVGRRHVVRAGGDPLDRPAELARAPAGQHLLAVDLELGAEAAAHLGGHDADLLLAQAHLDGEDHPRDVRDLRGAPHRQLALAPLGDACRAARSPRPRCGG